MFQKLTLVAQLEIKRNRLSFSCANLFLSLYVIRTLENIKLSEIPIKNGNDFYDITTCKEMHLQMYYVSRSWRANDLFSCETI